MAREKMVTRTVKQVSGEVLALNIVTAEPIVKEFTIPGAMSDYGTQEKLLSAVKKMHDTAEVKCVSVTKTAENEVLYGMSESDFIKYSKVLPPRSGNAENA